MCDEGRVTYHDLREQRLVGPMIEGLPASWDKAIANAAKRLGVFVKDPSTIGVVLSTLHSNEDNYALAKLAKDLGAWHVFVAGKPPVPARADGKLRVADVNPNAAGVAAIAAAVGLAPAPALELAKAIPPTLRALIVLGDVLPGIEPGKLAELEVIAISAHERGPVAHARVALPAAEWAENAGTVTNAKGMVQRMHAAFAPPGSALPAWEGLVRLGHALGVKRTWAHAREVFADMVSAVPAWNGLAWQREARPLQLRFAASRG
jgi:NADH dehydrogenase/NADH:ubiquinone oxidoreductase subunit G